MKSKYIKIGGIVLFIICVIGVILTAKYNKAEPVMATPETTETQESIAESTSVPKTESEIESTEETDLETAVTETEESLYTVIPIDPVKLYATANVNMRDLPDVSGNKIGSLSYGEEVTATGTVKEFNGIACYWLEVRTSKGLTGFVNGGYLVEERPNTNTNTNTTNSQTGQTGKGQTDNSQTDNSNSGLTDQTNTGTATQTPPVNTTPPVNNNTGADTNLPDGWSNGFDGIDMSGLDGDGYKETPLHTDGSSLGLH